MSWPNSVMPENTLSRHNPMKSCRDLKFLDLTKLRRNPDLLSGPSRSRQGNLCRTIVKIENKTLSRHRGGPYRNRKIGEKQLSRNQENPYRDPTTACSLRTMSQHRTRKLCHDRENLCRDPNLPTDSLFGPFLYLQLSPNYSKFHTTASIHILQAV